MITAHNRESMGGVGIATAVAARSQHIGGALSFCSPAGVVISADLNSLTFNAVVGVNPADQVVEVSNTGIGSLNFTAVIV